jgi:hypothetical protein
MNIERAAALRSASGVVASCSPGVVRKLVAAGGLAVGSDGCAALFQKPLTAR